MDGWLVGWLVCWSLGSSVAGIEDEKSGHCNHRKKRTTATHTAARQQQQSQVLLQAK